MDALERAFYSADGRVLPTHAGGLGRVCVSCLIASTLPADPPTLSTPWIHFSLTSLRALSDAEDRHFWTTTRFVLVARLIERYLGQQPIQLLDVGCGSGGLLRALRHRWPTATLAGLDGHEEALDLCRTKSGGEDLHLIHHHLTDMQTLRLETQPNVVVLLDVLEHLDDPAAVVRDLAGRLATGGIMIVSVPALPLLWTERDVFLGHRKRYRRSDLAALLSDAGLHVQHSSYLFAALFFPVFVFRRLTARLLGLAGQDMEHSELKVWPILNTLAAWWCRLELEIALRCTLPWGTSVYCLAQK